MGQRQRFSVKGKEVSVETIKLTKFLQAIDDLRGDPLTALRALKYCMTDESWAYLESVDFENTEEEDKLIGLMIQAVKDVNPKLFPKKAVIETPPTSTSGQPITSDGSPTS